MRQRWVHLLVPRRHSFSSANKQCNQNHRTRQLREGWLVVLKTTKVVRDGLKLRFHLHGIWYGNGNANADVNADVNVTVDANADANATANATANANANANENWSKFIVRIDKLDMDELHN